MMFEKYKKNHGGENLQIRLLYNISKKKFTGKKTYTSDVLYPL